MQGSQTVMKPKTCQNRSLPCSTSCRLIKPSHIYIYIYKYIYHIAVSYVELNSFRGMAR